MVLPASHRTRITGVLSAITLSVGVASTACLPSLGDSSLPAAASNPAPARSSANAIRIGKAVRGDLNGVLVFAAPVQSKGEVSIIPRVIARVDGLRVDVGSRVRAGDVVAELDHSILEQQVLEAQAAQASADAKLAALKAGPKPEVLAQAQANLKAAQARVNALETARSNGDASALDQRVKDARAAVDQAQAATEPDPQAVATADAAATSARTKLAQLRADPTKANDKAALDAAQAEVTKAETALTAAKTPRGSQTAVEAARRELQDAQQAQLMLRLSATAFDLDQARALLEVADAQVKLTSAPSTPEELRAAETTVEQAFAQAELARSRLRDATITAPINGIVSAIKASVGTMVGPSAAIVTLIPPDMQVIVQVDESQLGQLQVGQGANVSVEGFPKEAFAGMVKGIAPVLDPRTHSVAVQVDIPDPQGKLRPGMFAQLAIQVGQRAGALMVPREAVLRVGSVDPSAPVQSIVYTVTESRVHKQIVSLGASDGKNVEIVQGLQEGIDLVLNPRTDFLEGELISAT
jgi:HlyD family secretion protein